jgi:hypothetical protein
MGLVIMKKSSILKKYGLTSHQWYVLSTMGYFYPQKYSDFCRILKNELSLDDYKMSNNSFKLAIRACFQKKFLRRISRQECLDDLNRRSRETFPSNELSPYLIGAINFTIKGYFLYRKILLEISGGEIPEAIIDDGSRIITVLTETREACEATVSDMLASPESYGNMNEDTKIILKSDIEFIGKWRYSHFEVFENGYRCVLLYQQPDLQDDHGQ